MKKSKKRLLVWVNQILSGMLVLLGFTSCFGETPDEYGSPYAKYEIKGKVVDAEHQVIPGARILMRKGVLIGGDAIGFVQSDTTYTEKDGTFLYKTEGLYGAFRVVCEDTSGTYKADSTDVYPELTGGKGWYEGSSNDEANFELKKK